MAARRRRVVWTVSARTALEEILAYIVEDSPEGARQILHATLDLAASLETLSERGRVVPELNDPSVREVFVYRYRLLYEVKNGEVRILAFLHGARDFALWHKTQQKPL